MRRLLSLALLCGSSAAVAAPGDWRVSHEQLAQAKIPTRAERTVLGGMYRNLKFKVDLPGHRRGAVSAVVKNKQALNEHAAYVLSEAAGFDFVPPTTYRPARGKLAGNRFFGRSAQLFVRGRQQTPRDKTPYEVLDDHDQFVYLHLFDYLIGNSDRHFGNWMVETARPSSTRRTRLVAIDNGHLTFSEVGAPHVGSYRDKGSFLGLRSYELSEAHRLFVERIDPARVAYALAATGLPRASVELVLLRLANLRSAYPSAASGKTPGVDAAPPEAMRREVATLLDGAFASTR